MLNHLADVTNQPTMSGAAHTASTMPSPAMPASMQALRELHGLAVVELAGLAGILPDHLRAIEAGVDPTIPERQALAAALNIAVDRIA